MADTNPADGSRHERFAFRDRAALEDKVRRLGLDIPMSGDLSPLFEPLAAGGLRVPNRLVALPMEGADGDPDGAPTDLTVRRYRRFAAGGCGLLWFEAAAVSPEGRGNPRQLRLTDRTLPAFSTLVEETRRAAAEAGSPAGPPVLLLQLTHAGRFSRPEGRPAPVIAQHNPALDAGLGLPADFPLVADADLESLADRYAAAARLAREAGFDGVDVKACHGYLASELLASRTRTGSRYGGPLENRSRLLVEAVRAIRGAAPSLLVGCRLNLFDGLPSPYGFGADPGGGPAPDLSEPIELIGKLVFEGVGLFSVTCGVPAYAPHLGRPFDRPTIGGRVPAEHPLVSVARWLRLASAAQAASRGVPVVGGGASWLRAFSPSVAAEAVRSGRVALFGVGRGTLAYPDWPRELAARGALDPRRVCLTCSKCSEMLRGGSAVGCPVRDSDLYAPEYRRARRAARLAGRSRG